MKELKFKIGDRVRLTRDSDQGNRGLEGTVVSSHTSSSGLRIYYTLDVGKGQVQIQVYQSNLEKCGPPDQDGDWV